tara:strand:- start:526 stop:957 length:432 start_codon:yes stop_codon:yes gene_type:complete
VNRWWEKIPLEQMNQHEWESLCDGCGKCCRIQLEDVDGIRATTSVVCKYMDMQQCSCSVYQERTKLVPTCLKLGIDNINEIDWMPDTCAYRLIRDGLPLPAWHPLLTGDPESTHTSGNSVKGKVTSEDLVEEDQLEEFIIQWH